MFVSSTPRGGSRPALGNNTSAIQHIPFSTNLSNLSLELGRNNSSLATSPIGSDVTSISGHSFREDQQQKALEDENFKLKLRVYMLEERLQRQDSPKKSQVASPNTQLASLRRELAQKQTLLQQASVTLETLEHQHHQQSEARQRVEAERTVLEHSLEELEHQLTEQQQQQQRQKQEAEQLKQRLEAEVAILQRRLGEALQKQQRTEQERRRLQVALQQLKRQHAELTVARQSGTEGAADAPLDGQRQTYQQPPQHSVQTAAKPGIYIDANVVDPNEGNGATSREHNCAPDQCPARREADTLRVQLSAAAAQRRRAQAVAAAALQLQTERARSLQRSVQTLSEQLQWAQAQLEAVTSTRCREASPAAVPAAVPAEAAYECQPAASSTEVEVIAEVEMPELVAGVDEDPHHQCQTPSGRRSSSRTVAVSPPKRPTTLAVSPALVVSLNTSRAGSERNMGVREPALVKQTDDCDSYSEPDLDVSQARIGLGRGSLEPRQQPGGATSESDAGSGGQARRHHGSEARRLEQRVEALQQLRQCLRAEVAIYQQMLPPGGDQEKLQAAAAIPPRLLDDIGQLREQLVSVISHHQEGERRHSRSAPPPQELTLALTITQEALTKSTQKLSEVQLRNQKLRVRLQKMREMAQQTEQQREALRAECDSVIDNMRRVQENANKLAAENHELQQQQETSRQLQQQLHRADERQSGLEQLVRQLTQQLRQVAPTAIAASDSCAAEERIRQAEKQLLHLGRQRLKLLTESARMRSRCRLLRSEAAVQQNRAQEAVRSPGGEEEATPWHWDWMTEREQLLGQLGQARAAEVRLQAEHRGCDDRRRQDQRRMTELTEQLQNMEARVGELQIKAAHFEDTGQSCPESTRSCDLSVAPPLGSHSGSDSRESLKRSRAAAYSSPDLGIESDSQRCLSRTSQSTELSRRLSADVRTEKIGDEADRTGKVHQLAETQAALKTALQQLQLSEQRRQRFEGAVYREIGKTGLMVERVRGNAMRLSGGESLYE